MAKKQAVTHTNRLQNRKHTRLIVLYILLLNTAVISSLFATKVWRS